MPVINWVPVLAECAMVYCLVIISIVVGRLFIRRSLLMLTGGSRYSLVFHQFLAGLFLMVSVYSIVVAQLRTVNILILPLLFSLYRLKIKNEVKSRGSNNTSSSFPYAALGIAACVCVLLLNVFPESEYKQADAFYYLKIAESLNATGQENISHYYNQLSPSFHGLEPYHYFEIWLTSGIIRFTQPFFPSILVERFVTYGVLLSGIILGLYGLVEQLFQKPISTNQKLFCWLLLFILPNLLVFFPRLYHVFVSDFEGNLLERPNFRIIYLLLLPVVGLLLRMKTLPRQVILLLLLLCVVSFKCTVVLLPSMLIYALYLFWRKDVGHNVVWLPVVLFGAGFGLLYMLFPVKGVPTLYGVDTRSFLLQTLSKSTFIVFSIITSFVYVILLIIIFCSPVLVRAGRKLHPGVRALPGKLLLLLIIGVVGIIVGRLLFLKDNAYQFLFIAHIIATLVIWLVYLFSMESGGTKKVVFLGGILLISVFLFKLFFVLGKPINTYVQNGRYMYNGLPYSKAYLQKVDAYFKQHRGGIGGYAADSVFYQSVYYSRRNPNVYFLPLTYVVAGRHNGNIEVCLSDSVAIISQVVLPIEREYLGNAINRSAFFQYQRQQKSVAYKELVEQYIQLTKLAYIIVTKGYDAGYLQPRVKQAFSDETTGERFLVL
jgi:hypothetical protein